MMKRFSVSFLPRNDRIRHSCWLAANEIDLESAKDADRRAKNALEEAAFSARDCGCDTAAVKSVWEN